MKLRETTRVGLRPDENGTDGENSSSHVVVEESLSTCEAWPLYAVARTTASEPVFAAEERYPLRERACRSGHGNQGNGTKAHQEEKKRRRMSWIYNTVQYSTATAVKSADRAI